MVLFWSCVCVCDMFFFEQVAKIGRILRSVRILAAARCRVRVVCVSVCSCVGCVCCLDVYVSCMFCDLHPSLQVAQIGRILRSVWLIAAARCRVRVV